ncbi:MAG: hypothetical protein R6V45_11420 [Oceanipulchritudo sp.]
MDPRQRGAFVVPFILLLSTGMLLLAVLALERSLDSARRASIRALPQRARLTLELNVNPLKEVLEARLLRSPAASAATGDPARPVALHASTGVEVPLHSRGEARPVEGLSFTSSLGPHSLYAEMVPGKPSASSSTMDLAWAAEDISLFGISSPPPETWPLEGWAWAPLPEGESSLTDFRQPSLETGLSIAPPVPVNDPLPLMVEASPALVPVVRNLELHLGVFASGATRTREKTVRVRYHIAGEIWNPYNRSMEIHPGDGFSPSFRVIFWNLPQVRLTNLSRGLSSGWLSLDAAANSASGAEGMSAWIELPGLLRPGEILRFLEPDPSSQPEGLARTLHPAFMTGPADRIRMEWRQPDGGLHAACLDLARGSPLDRAIAGAGWFRAEAFYPDLPEELFFRADDGPKPFYLAGGSLSYRIDNAHLALSLKQGPALLDLSLDPRRRRILGDAALEDAAGNRRQPHEVFHMTAFPRPPRPDQPALGSIREPLFSWPANPPQSMLQAMDLPVFEEGFRLGSSAAWRVNAALDQGSPWETDAPASLPRSPGTEGKHVLPYRPVFPVNLRAPKAWEDLLRKSSSQTSSPPRARFPAYPHPVPGRESDFLEWEQAAISTAAAFLSAKAASVPSRSVGRFFSRGLLGDAFPARTSSPQKTALMPLRGWLRKAPAPRPRGAAWVLHLAVRLEGHPSLWKSARVWLLEYQISGEQPRLEVIRFEWTVPEHHLVRSPRGKETPVDSGPAVPESGPPPRST